MDTQAMMARYPRSIDHREDWLPVIMRFIDARYALRKLATAVHHGYDAKDQAAEMLALCDMLDAEHDQWLAQRNAAHTKAERVGLAAVKESVL